MLRSMTGYASAAGRRDKTAVSIAVKSVNHRFLDLHLRLPVELEALEPQVRRVVRGHLSRGHVDLTVVLEREGGVVAHIDRALVRAYLEAYDGLRQEFGLAAEADLNAVLRAPGALTYQPAAMAEAEAMEMESLVLGTLAEALDRLDSMRAEEARSIAVEMRGRLEQICRSVEQIESLRLGAETFYHQRLRDRLAELLADSLPPDRLAQEAALLVERSDVSEELLRLRSHVAQFQGMLAAGAPGGLLAGQPGAFAPGAAGGGARETGKRLDFLLQEMGRESNTILSKTSGLGEAGIRITDQGLQVKAEIEKLREQVQNLQ